MTGLPCRVRCHAEYAGCSARLDWGMHFSVALFIEHCSKGALPKQPWPQADLTSSSSWCSLNL